VLSLVRCAQSADAEMLPKPNTYHRRDQVTTENAYRRSLILPKELHYSGLDSDYSDYISIALSSFRAASSPAPFSRVL